MIFHFYESSQVQIQMVKVGPIIAEIMLFPNRNKIKLIITKRADVHKLLRGILMKTFF